ncbi:MAG: LPXTG cell wall anchor domain-containing protein [Microbacterium sp.]
MITMRHVAAASALLVTAVFVPSAARADELDDTGVRVDVEISPLECVIDCVPSTPGIPGGSPLPATGADLPALFVWLALCLLAAGVALVVRSRIHRMPSPERAAADSASYYVVSGRRSGAARAGHIASSRASGPSQGDSSGRDVERSGS